MSRFLRLLKKDLEAMRWPLAIIPGITILLLLFLRYKLSAGWPQEALIAALVIPLNFIPFWLLGHSFQNLRSEWREDTIYTLLVLPVPGWQITLSKLVSHLVEYTILLGVALGGILILFRPQLLGFLTEFPTSWLLWNGFLLYLISLCLIATMIVFIQLSFVVSKMVGRLQGLVVLWVLFLASWFVGKLGVLLEPAFRWLASVPLHRIFRLAQIERDIILEWNIAPQIGTWLGTILLFILTGYLLEHYVEING